MKPREDRRRPVVFPEPDAVIEEYKKHLDRTLLRENLKRSIAERVANLIALQRLAAEARDAGHSPTRSK